jgi:predicted MFS family arabinose efflux permease
MQRIINLYRSSYSGLTPESWWLALVMLINRSGTMVVPFMTLYLKETQGFSTAQAGLVMGVFGAGAICGGLIGGKLSDTIGFYNVQLISLGIGGLLFFVLGQMSSLPAICACSFVLALVNDSFRPANSVAVAAYSKPDDTTRSYSLNRLAINLGWALGGALGGFIAAHNYQLLFIIDGCTNVGAAILLRIILKPIAWKKQKTAEAPTRRFEVYRDKPYMFFSALVLLFSLTFFQLFSTLPIYYKDGLGLSERQIGMTMTMNGLIIALFEMVLVFKLDGKRHPLRYIPLGTLLVAASFMIFLPGIQAFWIAILSTLLVTTGEMFSMPFMNTYWISRTTDENRGSYAGIFSIAWAIAQVFGPSGGAWIAEHAGFTILWWITGLTALAASSGFWWLGRVERDRLKS